MLAAVDKAPIGVTGRNAEVLIPIQEVFYRVVPLRG
jgi:hypothetical protein